MFWNSSPLITSFGFWPVPLEHVAWWTAWTPRSTRIFFFFKIGLRFGKNPNYAAPHGPPWLFLTFTADIFEAWKTASALPLIQHQRLKRWKAAKACVYLQFEMATYKRLLHTKNCLLLIWWNKTNACTNWLLHANRHRLEKHANIFLNLTRKGRQIELIDRYIMKQAYHCMTDAWLAC